MHFSLATKVFLAFIIVIVNFLLVLVFGITRTQETYSQIRSINHVIVPLSFRLSDIQADLKAFNLVLNEDDPLVLKRTLQVTRLGSTLPLRFNSKITKALSLFDAESEENPLIREIKKDVGELQELVNELTLKGQAFSDRVLAPETNLDSTNVQRAELLSLSAKIDEKLSVIHRQLRTITQKGLEGTKRQERSSLYALAIATGIALLIAIFLIWLVGKNLRPLAALTAATKRIAGGDYIPIKIEKLGSSEVATLGKEFNSMVRSLKERDDELRVQHQKLLKSERLATVGRMTSVITHELRNPLSSINLNSEMLMEIVSQSEDSEAIPILDLIISEVDRLREITDNYLGYTKTQKPEMVRTNLSEVITKLVDFHEWEWTDLEVEIVDEIQGDLFVKGDKNQLRQAFLNLIKNAVEASRSGQKVVLNSQKKDGFVMISIEDSGDGIPTANLKDLFEPFVTTKTKGTGLGLAVTQQIIEEHEGKISVETSPAGTIFSVSLPHTLL